MSHIKNITRATKAYHILSEATNVHLELTEMIARLGRAPADDSQSWRALFAAFKALTGKTFTLGTIGIDRHKCPEP